MIFPHLIVPIGTWPYAPGQITGTLFVLPTAPACLFHSFALNHWRADCFLIIAAILIPSILVLFNIGQERL